MFSLDIVFWHWWVLAVFLLAIEMLVPGFFFLWMSAAGFVTGCLLLLLPVINVETQFLVFSILSVISIVVWKVFVKNHPTHTDQPLLNKRSAHYIGRVFNLIEPIENGQGKIKVGDSIWKVSGEDCDISTKVKVTGADGTILKVEKI